MEKNILILYYCSFDSSFYLAEGNDDKKTKMNCLSVTSYLCFTNDFR